MALLSAGDDRAGLTLQRDGDPISSANLFAADHLARLLLQGGEQDQRAWLSADDDQASLWLQRAGEQGPSALLGASDEAVSLGVRKDGVMKVFGLGP